LVITTWVHYITMLIKNVDIRKFKGIKALAKPLELKKFNLLISRNSVSKSSILQVLYLIVDPRIADTCKTGQIPPYSNSPLRYFTPHGLLIDLVYGYAKLC
jgi:hypothetical protein